MARRRQHYKGKKRPRAWHRSRSSSLRYYRLLKLLDERTARLKEHLPPTAGRETSET